MTTIRDVVDGALSEVYGQAQTVDITTYLSAPVTETSLVLTVASAKGFSRGIAQVDDELLIVDSADMSKNELAVRYVSGRGVRATKAAPHEVGALVTMAPSIPRHRVVQAVAEAITGSSGLFRVGVEEFPYSGAKSGYSLPDEVDDVLSVSWFPSGPSNQWAAVRRWTWDRHNRTLIIGDAVQPGRPVRVAYSATPIAPEQDEDFSVSGLPNTCIDVIRYGAAWRITSFLESFNLLPKSAEAEAMDRGKTPGSRLRVSQYYFSMYQQRLQAEATALQVKHPIRQHFSGSW